MFGQLFVTVLAAGFIWFVVDTAVGLRKNIKAAKASGLEWIITRKFYCLLIVDEKHVPFAVPIYSIPSLSSFSSISVHARAGDQRNSVRVTSKHFRRRKYPEAVSQGFDLLSTGFPCMKSTLVSRKGDARKKHGTGSPSGLPLRLNELLLLVIFLVN